MRAITSLFVSLSLLAQAPPDTGDVKFSSNTQLVVQMVTVKDKDGKAVEGLTAKDFTITEDGKPQQIRFCEFQRLEGQPQPVTTTAPPAAPRAIGTQAEIAPEKPGDLRYRNRRLLVLYFDQSSTPVPDQFRSLDAAGSFLRRQVTPADLVAIFSYARGSVRIHQDFTDDRALLQQTLATLSAAVSRPETGMEDETDAGSAFGQDYGEFNIFNTDRQLAALQTAVKMLDKLNEKKSLVYFASGLKLSGLDNQAQLRATINAAVRANVALFTVDARGLVAEAPLGDATMASPGGNAMYTGGAADARATRFAQSQDTLWTLAADTGGKALLDNNNLSLGIVNAQQSITSYYVIGYYSSNEALDGRFRRIKVTLNNALDAQLDYRRGYWAGKRFAEFTASDKERQLEEALMLATR